MTNEFLSPQGTATSNLPPRAPRWVECAEKAAAALEQGNTDVAEHWRRLAETFKSA